MLPIVNHSKNLDSQTALQMIFENGAKAIATCSRGLQLARLKLSIKYQCCGRGLQSSHQKNIRFDWKSIFCNLAVIAPVSVVRTMSPTLGNWVQLHDSSWSSKASVLSSVRTPVNSRTGLEITVSSWMPRRQSLLFVTSAYLLNFE